MVLASEQTSGSDCRQSPRSLTPLPLGPVLGCGIAASPVAASALQTPVPPRPFVLRTLVVPRGCATSSASLSVPGCAPDCGQWYAPASPCSVRAPDSGPAHTPRGHVLLSRARSRCCRIRHRPARAPDAPRSAAPLLRRAAPAPAHRNGERNPLRHDQMILTDRNLRRVAQRETAPLAQKSRLAIAARQLRLATLAQPLQALRYLRQPLF